MADFNMFNTLVADLANKQHNFASDQLGVALTNTPPVATNAVIGDLTQISYANLSSRDLTTLGSTQTGGIHTVSVGDLTLTASGTVEQFRFVVVYNTTNGRLIGWYDKGAGVNLSDGDNFLIDFANDTLFELRQAA